MACFLLTVEMSSVIILWATKYGTVLAVLILLANGISCLAASVIPLIGIVYPAVIPATWTIPVIKADFLTGSTAVVIPLACASLWHAVSAAGFTGSVKPTGHTNRFSVFVTRVVSIGIILCLTESSAVG